MKRYKFLLLHEEGNSKDCFSLSQKTPLSGFVIQQFYSEILYFFFVYYVCMSFSMILRSSSHSDDNLITELTHAPYLLVGQLCFSTFKKIVFWHTLHWWHKVFDDPESLFLKPGSKVYHTAIPSDFCALISVLSKPGVTVDPRLTGSQVR